MHKNKQCTEDPQYLDILTSSRLAQSIEPFICASFSPISDTFGDLLRMRWHKHRRKSIWLRFRTIKFSGKKIGQRSESLQ